MSQTHDSTKVAISDALKRLAAQTPLDKVRVVDIQREAHVSHRTFYYHFDDKYDAVVWTFCRDMELIFERAGVRTEGCPGDSGGELPRILPPFEHQPGRPIYQAYVRSLVEFMSANRAYYRSVFASSDRRNLRGFFEEASYRTLRSDLAYLLRDVPISEYELYTIGHYLADADVASVLRWISGDVTAEIVRDRGFQMISPMTPLFLEFVADYLRARYADAELVPERAPQESSNGM